MKKSSLFFLLISFLNPLYSQNKEIGFLYGKFYSIYQFSDEGTGFRNLPGSQYNGYPSISVNYKIYKRISIEATGSYMIYQQYNGTRLYSAGFSSAIYGGNISLTANYYLINLIKFECRVKGGIGIGIIPDKYQGSYSYIFNSPDPDSVSRGTIKRDFLSVFPTLCTGVDFSYKVARRFKISLLAQYQKGLTKITEYDIYYNDGTGFNDQHAKQWGKGTIYGFQLGVKYLLRTKEERKKYLMKKFLISPSL